MKLITSRHGRENFLNDARILQKTMSQIQGRALIPKGVYRFKTMKEAHQWMIQQMPAIHARQKFKACGIDYTEAKNSIEFFSLDGVSIPVVKKELLIRMKDTIRPSDKMDVEFLKVRIEEENKK